MKNRLSVLALCAVFCLCAFANTDDCAPLPLPDPVFGLTPLRCDWREVAFHPVLDEEPPLNLRIPIPYGAVQMTFNPEEGYHVRIPVGVTFRDESPAGVAVTVTEDAALNMGKLSEADQGLLESKGWRARVGDAQAIWVSVARQMLYLVQGDNILWQVPIATSRLGAGQLINSMKTPLGWHQVSEKYGDSAPWGQVFRSRAATAKIWDGREQIPEGLVLTRILWLEGLEDGVNKGKNAEGAVVDSKQRYIYLHGTNKEHCIGTPMSDGCVNMYNDDVIKLYEKTPVGTPVFISDF